MLPTTTGLFGGQPSAAAARIEPRPPAPALAALTFTLLERLPPSLEEGLEALRQAMAALPQVVVAYSGGVDSALVACLAVEQCGSAALAITGVSPALAPHLRQEAAAQARWLGIAHREIATAELADPAYSSNPVERCYACKRELHRLLAPVAAAAGDAAVLDGVNHDDLGDHRPGIRAAREHGVRSPLAEVGIDKAGVRQISRALGLPWWDKPAQPCLASRFPYGEAITAARLHQVAAAEAWLLERGWPRLRVRCQGETARIELPESELTAALEQWRDGSRRRQLVEAFQALGFTAVAVDLEGLVSGKLNRGLAPLRPPQPADGC
ncbi:ATP-dependent sacrificial sulfur transferase LarE [Cyanobium sp. LEGE 06143]|nr:ATP-dependent sacrificial sulfur transferase LarE [Cyanobium sp. LEGE 06143]